ncbi:C40 family peptidase [Ruegeria sp. HKCCD7255]|uniref:C40 family peptidase n=1 Tax=Ruegeria sp. HKCCD7255 TaxID=2683004 RepID=UPI001489CF82|nr:C40 family peptidase [Ruegeria sp. HKCCD7255]
MDRRLLRSNGRVAHSSLKGQVEAEHFTEGEVTYFQRVVTDILDDPEGTRQCQLLSGEAFVVLDKTQKHLFGYREKDGYVGWVDTDMGLAKFHPTHRVCVPRAVALQHPDVTKNANEQVLPFGCGVEHWPEHDAMPSASGWMPIKHPSHIATPLYLRDTQLAKINWRASDPAAVAESFLTTPYIYGGDTALGIDCSGLMQTAFNACGLSCPRDSDMQLAFFEPIQKTDLRRGDLVFWKGHVGMILDPGTLLHANAYHMAVANEPLDQAIQRIGQKEFGAVIGFGRHPAV